MSEEFSFQGSCNTIHPFSDEEEMEESSCYDSDNEPPQGAQQSFGEDSAPHPALATPPTPPSSPPPHSFDEEEEQQRLEEEIGNRWVTPVISDDPGERTQQIRRALFATPPSPLSFPSEEAVVVEERPQPRRRILRITTEVDLDTGMTVSYRTEIL